MSFSFTCLHETCGVYLDPGGRVLRDKVEIQGRVSLATLAATLSGDME